MRYDSFMSCHFTQLNISTDNTNCSATEVLVDHMISLYANNCAAVQTSHTFLTQTPLSFFTMLRNPVTTMYANCATVQTFNILLAHTSNVLYHILNKTTPTGHTDTDGIMPSSDKNWCIVWPLICVCIASYNYVCVHACVCMCVAISI